MLCVRKRLCSAMASGRLVDGRQLRRLSSTLLKKAEADAALKRPRMEEIVLVRHGESEGNLAFNRSVAGDHSLYADEFLERHSSFWRLTDQGRAQALTTGEWMRKHIDVGFDSFFSSEYLRALETAALLKLPDARWKPEVMLRERDWGEYDLASQLERRVAFKRYEARRRRESLFWAPPGGESLAQVVQRVDSVLLFGNRRWRCVWGCMCACVRTRQATNSLSSPVSDSASAHAWSPRPAAAAV